MNKTLQQQLQEDTAALAMEIGRRVGTPGHEIAMNYIHDRMEAIGLEPYIGESFMLPYTAKARKSTISHTEYTQSSLEMDEESTWREELAMEMEQLNAPSVCVDELTEQSFCNLVGVIPGKDRSLPPLLIGAHYDSVIDAPCADDNATSVALNLAIAEAFVKQPLDRDLIIAFFDAEEPPYFLGPCMGSNRFYQDHCQSIQFAGVIVTDLIGHDLDISGGRSRLGSKIPGVGLATRHFSEFVFLMGAESDGVFPEVIEKVADGRKGLRILPTLNRYVGNMSDHHAFEQAGQPFLFLSCAQGKYYHHPKDDLEWINFEKLAKITEFVRDVLSQLDLTPAGNAPYAIDPYEFESRMIQKAVGKPLSLLAKAFGHEIPKTRESITRFVSNLRSMM
ncbi:MAG: M28 family peptidase [Pseudomonadales bacterium]